MKKNIKLFGFNKYIFFSVLVILSLSNLIVYSISTKQPYQPYKLYTKHLIFTSAGIFFMISVSFIPWEKIFSKKGILFLGYLIGVILLFVTALAGIELNHNKAWIRVGGFLFQPTEFAKYTTIFYLAYFIRNINTFMQMKADEVFYFLILFSLPVAALILQRDMGSMLVLFVSIVIIFLLFGIETKWIIIPFVLIALLVSILYSTNQNFHNRINNYKFIDLETTDFGYQSKQALIALGSGGIKGVGIARSTQAYPYYLFAASNDFILAIWGEEYGFIGLLFLMAMYFVLFYNMIKFIISCSNLLIKSASAGILVVLFLYFAVNVSVTLALIPVTGLPLPFFSTGGSAILTNCFAMGIFLHFTRLSNSTE